MRTGTAITRGTILCGLVGAALMAGGALTEPATEYERSGATPGTPPPAELAAADRAHIQDNFGKLPLSFIENRGQADERVAYYIQSPGHGLYFTQDGHALRLTQGKGEDAKAHTIKVELVNAAAERIESLERAPSVVSYFKGPKEQWKAGIPTHARIGYVQPWPGIDLAYDGHGGKLESIYTVAPHANPAQIKLRYTGQDSLKLDEAGNLVYTTSVGEVKETAPVLYQEIDGSRVAVEGRYALLDENTVGFQVAAYNAEHALVIDPTLVYAGFIGGSGSDQGNGIAVDSAGNAYVTGHALSTEAMNFPVTVGPDLTHNGGNYDAFVAKVSADGTALVYAGYIGGSGYDDGRGIAVDSTGNAYVIGDTSSTAASFPVTVGPDLSHNGSTDAFVAKVSADGTALVYAGYIGGSEGEAGISIAVDSTGNAYVTGQTNSGQATFPETVGPDLTHNSLGQFGQSLASDAFIAKVNADGSALVYAGYIGGSAGDGASGIAVDSAGNAYVAGATSSTEATFPEAVGPDLIYNGGTDAFVAKVNAAGTALDYAGYIGGSGTDLAIAEGNVIAVDSAGNAYVSGYTNSTEATFPVLVGPDLTFNGADDAFVAKVNAAGSALDYAGYIGGSGTEQGHGIAVDSAGNAYVTGWTSSTEAAGFPVTGGPDLTHNGGGVDAFVAKVNAAGSALDYAGYIGGDGNDRSFGIAVDSAGNAYVTGFTSSTEASFPATTGPVLTFSGGGQDAFVVKIGPSAPPPDTTPDTFTLVDQTGVARSTLITSNDVTITGINAPAAVSVTGGEYSVGCTGSFTAAAGSIGNGQTVCVQHISSASFSTATDTALTVGGVSDTFTSTTVAPDTTPDVFNFRDPSGVPRSTLITSDTVTIGGINSPAAVSVTGGEYSIGCGGTFTASAGTISNGQTVCVRHTSAATFNTAADTALTIGGVSDTFTSITQAQDLQPDTFSFTDASDVPLNSLQTSNNVTVSGINDAAPISVSGGEYSIGCTPTFTSADGVITSGQTVCLRHTAAATHSTMTSTTLSIGGVMDTFTSTTEAAGPPPDTTPDAFSFTYQPDVPLSSVRTSSTVTIGGINSPAAVTVSGGQYSIGCDGTFTAGAGSISNGQTVCVRHTSSPSYDTTVDTALTIGGISSTFSSRTRVANSTPVFSFTDQSAVSLGTVITSNTVTISGLEITNVPISVTGGQYSIGCNTNFTSADGTISNTQTVCVRHTSSLIYGTATHTALTVGGGSDTFTSITAAAPPSGGGGGGGSLPSFTLLMLSLMTGLGRWLRGFATPQQQRPGDRTDAAGREISARNSVGRAGPKLATSIARRIPTPTLRARWREWGGLSLW